MGDLVTSLSLDSNAGNLEQGQSFAAQVGERLKEALAGAERDGLLSLENKPLPILLALSGGPDSSALLLALHAVAQQHSLALHVCHINHGMRGSDSDADEAFCHALCRQFNLPLTVLKDEESKAAGELLPEDLLRERRYHALAQAARERQVKAVVTGHTLDDQVETVLFRIFRGTSLHGLVGMREARPLSEDGIVLLRPMLLTAREDCLQFLQSNNVQPRHDTSNDDDRYARNFIRQRVLPLIDSRFPGAKERIERLRKIVEDEERWLDELVEEAMLSLEDESGNWCLEKFARMNDALKRRVVAHALMARSIEVSFERVEAVLKVAANHGSPALSLNARFDFALNAGGKTAIWKDKEDEACARDIGEFRVKIPGTTIVPALGKALRIETWTGRRVVYPAPDALIAIVNLSTIKTPLFIRSRRQGDVIQPFGMNEPVRLKKYLHTHKATARHARQFKNIVLSDSDEVLWVPGSGLSEKLRVRGSAPSHRMEWLDLASDVTIA